MAPMFTGILWLQGCVQNVHVCEPQIPVTYVIFKGVIQISSLNSTPAKQNSFTGRAADQTNSALVRPYSQISQL